MTDLIMDTADLLEIGSPDVDPESMADLTATKTADPQTMDFHVQMRGYTMADFETMVVQAAAQQLLSGRTFKSEIQAEAIRQANEKLNSEVAVALNDVMKITVTKRGQETITLAQMIGLEAKDYLTQPVNSRGEFDTSGYHNGGRQPRVAYLVSEYVKAHFAKEIKAAMDATIADLKSQIAALLAETIKAERERVSRALSYEIDAKR